jgi:hypothetical protein
MTAYTSELEALIDRYGIADVLHCIERICDAKAEHVAVNWQDTTNAKRWSRYADAISRIRIKIK